jgi:hypothetical protein
MQLELNVAIEWKPPSAAVARIETRGVSRVDPPFARSLDRLPASFWARFEESLSGTTPDDGLDPTEFSLVQAARDLGYHTGHEILESAEWSDFILPLDSEEASDTDVLHATFAMLSGLGLADCEIVELAPFDCLVLRVYGYWGALIPGPKRNRRTATLVTRGMCAAVMDLAYGGPYDSLGIQGVGTFACKQTRSVDRGDRYDEFVTTRL